MTLASAPSPAPITQPPLGQEPLRLPWDLRLTPEQFAQVCQANPDAVLELDADGRLTVMTPTGGETGCRNSQLMIQLALAVQRAGQSLRMFDSSTGFRLPDGSVLSPDAALVLEERWQSLTPEERRGFPPLCPDLVVELASPGDEGPRGVGQLRRKMGLYQANGARLGWLLLPEERSVEIWQGGQEGMAERLENATRLEGGEGFVGLVVDLETIWEA
ncbi:MAG: Uma2 family endonuclease [Synechococcaceae cyanobacterium]|nr:Uma2 family endonuclease [Synechococcaceae cyanobacterium]